MPHECIQPHRLFILERDLTAETAKRSEDMGEIRDTLAKISKGIANLGENTSRELQALRKEVSALAKIVKRGGKG